MSKTKKEIDKDIMYGKIMPSAKRNTASITTADYSERDEGAAIKMLENETAKHTPAMLIDKNGLEVKSEHSTLVVNLQEYLIMDKLEAAFAKFNCCKCERCKKDVVALALNKLPPAYVVIEQSELDAELEKHNLPAVSTALIQAILKVRANPRH